MDTSPVFRHAGLAETRLRPSPGPGELPAMPLPKRVDPDGDEEPLSLIDRALSAFQWGQRAKPRSSGDEIPRVGKYKADYSELTPEEIAADAGCEELFKNSKPVSR